MGPVSGGPYHQLNNKGKHEKNFAYNEIFQQILGVRVHKSCHKIKLYRLVNHPLLQGVYTCVPSNESLPNHLIT